MALFAKPKMANLLRIHPEGLVGDYGTFAQCHNVKGNEEGLGI